MKLISDEIALSMGKSSWIRKMFEAGAQLRKKLGEENVYDFSLGNPDLPPPPEAQQALREIADGLGRPYSLGYTQNPGWLPFREALAKKLAAEQGVAGLKAENVIVTCGAAGAICSFFRAVMNPGDEVIVPSPYFVEYGAYAAHFGGRLVPVPSAKDSFEPDIEAIKAAVTDRTRVILFNTPNNPTGVVYAESAIEDLASLAEEINAHRERPVFLLSDEPYRFLTFDGAVAAPVLSKSPYAVVLGSFSKSLSMAGERVGYIAFNPALPGLDLLLSAVTLTTRTLGFVNAPIIGQRLAMSVLSSGVDLSVYARRREAMLSVLDAAGLEYAVPRGAFYVFPKTPTQDDVAFVTHLVSFGILAVPGSGFGQSGHMRLSYSLPLETIERSREALVRAAAAWKSR